MEEDGRRETVVLWPGVEFGRDHGGVDDAAQLTCAVCQEWEGGLVGILLVPPNSTTDPPFRIQLIPAAIGTDPAPNPTACNKACNERTLQSVPLTLATMFHTVNGKYEGVTLSGKFLGKKPKTM